MARRKKKKNGTGANVAGGVLGFLLPPLGIVSLFTGWKPGFWKSATIGSLVGLTATAAGVIFGKVRELSAGASSSSAPVLVGPFPDLKVGAIVLVDTVKANLLFVPDPTVVCEVDGILSDPQLVSVAILGGGQPGRPPAFSGTIPRSAIIRVISDPVPGGLQL